MEDIKAVLNKQDYDYPVQLTWGGDYSLKSWGDLVD